MIATGFILTALLGLWLYSHEHRGHTMKIAAAIILSLMLVDTANACSRCGIFGRRCRFQQQVVVQKVQKVYAQPQVVYPQAAAVQYPQQVVNYSISNVYPAGTTQYASQYASTSVQQLSSLFSVNPELAITAASRAADGANQSLTAAIQMGTLGNQEIAEIARIQAATQHLQAAVSGSAQQQSSSVTLRIVQSGTGIKIEQVDAPPAEPQPEELPPAPPQPPATLLHSKCSKCHGADLTQPKAGLFFDSAAEISADAGMRAIQIVNGIDVPEAMHGLIEGLTAEDRQQLISELVQLYRKDEP